MATLGLELTDLQLDLFEEFEDALYQANEVMNLTRVAREECWLRHYVDCLLFHDLIPKGSTVADIGTGPGFPSWPLATARPDLAVTAVDSNGKMLGFLRTQGLPNLTVDQLRAEEWGVREEFDVVTGRAVAPLAAQIEISVAPCKVGGKLILMRTPADNFDLEVRHFGLERTDVILRELPGTDIVRAFVIYTKVHKTNSKYPRRWADIKKSL